MQRSELIEDMKKSTDGSGFMNKSELARYLGIDRHNVKPYTDLCAPVIGRQRYYVGDLADAIIRLR